MKNVSHQFSRRLIGSTASLILFAASAVPALAVPSYARGDTDATIQGRIRSIDGTYALSLHDDRGFLDSVHLHQGTIINPTGLRLSPGMQVTIRGFSDGNDFEANEIDTSYQYNGPAVITPYVGPEPYYSVYAPGYEVPVPVYYPYYYGPSYGVTVITGGYGHWDHGGHAHFR